MDVAAWTDALLSSAFVHAMRALASGARDVIFLRPWWLLGLLGLPPLLWWWWRRRRTQSVWRDAIDPHLLRHLLQGEAQADGGRMHRLGRVFAALALTVGYATLFLALAGPSWRKSPQPLWEDRTPLVIALDLSQRVLATDLPPSRLQRARAEIAEILRRRGGGQIALVAYAGDAFTVTPLTEDFANVALYLDALHPNIMPKRGSRTDRGIAESALLLRRAGFRRGDILVITDMLDGDERRAESAASDAASEGYRVSVLGLASERGAQRMVRGVAEAIRLDGSALASLAAEGKGKYAAVTVDDSDLVTLGVLDAQRMEATSGGGKRGAMAIDEGYWLLPLLLLTALFAFRRGVLAVALLCCLPWQPAQAADGDLWLRQDQQAHRAMQRAGEAFRRRDYATAERLWQTLPGADADYNRGNALARQGRYPEAIDAYDEALRAQPQMTDAIENRRAVVEAMRRKPPKNDRDQDRKQDDPKNDGKQDGEKNQGKSDQGQQPNAQQQPGGDPQQSGQPPKPQNPKDSGQNRNDGSQPQNGQNGQNGQQNRNPNGAQTPPNPSSNPPRPNDAGRDPQRDRNAPRPSDAQGNDGGGKQQRDDPNAQREADAAQRERMERALAQRPRPVPSGAGETGRPETAQERQVRILNEARLRRVPDDPGGLLRAKFEQEYRRRASGDERR